MTLVTVEVADLAAASRAMTHEVADPLTTLVGGALDAILSGGGMAGDDPGGEQWASCYDRIAPAAIQAAEDVINSCYRTSAMLGATARNYACAEAASTARGHQVDPHIAAAVATLPPDTHVGLPSGVPSASAGAGSPDLPTGWHFIAHHLGGYVWPNGHQDRLRAAAAAWRRSAAALDGHATAAAWVELGPMVDNLREGDDIATVCQALDAHLQTVARAHRGLAHACSQLASHIDHTHSRVEHELLELAAWTGAIQGVGALASIFSLGAAEAPTQIGQGARIAETVAAVISILKDFVAAVKAVLAEIGPLADAVADVRAAVAWLKDLRIVQVEVAAVPGLRVYQVARIERAGGAVASTTEVGKDAAAAERLASEGSTVGTGRTRWTSGKKLREHFRKHKGDFGSTSVDEYADEAAAFFDRSAADGYLRKVDADGTVRIYDPKTNTFGSFSKEGRTHTYFKPRDGLKYFERQPGATP